MKDSTFKKIAIVSLIFSAIAVVFALSGTDRITLGGNANVGVLDQWSATSTPDTAVTQRTYGKTVKISGMSTGCVTSTAGVLSSAGIPCAGTSSGFLVQSVASGAINGANKSFTFTIPSNVLYMNEYVIVVDTKTYRDGHGFTTTITSGGGGPDTLNVTLSAGTTAPSDDIFIIISSTLIVS